MGLQPRESHRLASRQAARRSSIPDTAVVAGQSASQPTAATSPPKSPVRRRLSVPEAYQKLPGTNLDKVLRPGRTQSLNNNTMAASSPRRPVRYSTGDVPTAARLGTGPASPRRPNRPGVTSSTQRIKEEISDGEDDIDGAASTGVFDISRLASSPKPPRRQVNTTRPLRHSVCVAPSDLVAAGLDDSPPLTSDESATITAEQAAAAERKRKRVRFSVPDIRLTEEQLEELAGTASAAAQDREKTLAAPCSDIFRKTMLDMQFLSMEQRQEEEAQSSSSPSTDT